MRAHVAEECKNDYAAQLQKYNKEQNQFYFNDMPLIFNVSKLPTAAWYYIYIHAFNVSTVMFAKILLNWIFWLNFPNDKWINGNNCNTNQPCY